MKEQTDSQPDSQPEVEAPKTAKAKSPQAYDPKQQIVQMLPNKPNAAWETIVYSWPAAIKALGKSYDIRRVDKASGSVIETRSKTPSIAAPLPPGLSGSRANVNLEFERWWETNSGNEAAKEFERTAFISGWMSRQNAR